ncbi:MAG TPA: protein kinase [Rugosimonospora sp.]|nr:protein kinase [Rugosimonospora sp.]
MVSAGMVLGGRYKLDERIAGGGMGDVWRGTDEVLGRTIAVKILLPALLDEAGFAERFRGEARTMATINHPGVVDVYDYGSDSAVGAYLVMEYVEGDPLSRTLTRVGRLTPGRTMALIAQAADALQAAHDKGIVHRDVKPGNLLVRPNGTLVLTDFGIARSALVGQLTAVGSVLGTASYISPEQASGGVATPLSDVYALGVVAYQCLSGRRPFEGDNPIEIAMKHVREQPAPLPADIPPAVRRIVERAMAKDPAARFPSAAALGQVARQSAAGLAGGPPGSPVSGAPITSQTSPGPMGSPVPISPVTGPRPPVAPGGTRVMPPYPPGVTTGRTPVPAGGGYNRGAASVPPAPPRRPDTSYFPAAAPAGPGTGSSRKGVVAGVIVGLLLLLSGLAIGGWLLVGHPGAGGNGGGDTGTGTTGTTGQAAASGASPTGPDLVDVNCTRVLQQNSDQAEAALTRKHFKVDKQYRAGGRKGRVAGVSPCPSAPSGSVVTLIIFTGPADEPSNPAPSCGQVGAPLDCPTPSPDASGEASSSPSPASN